MSSPKIDILPMVARKLMKHFDTLDTAAGVGKRDGLVGMSDLDAVAKNEALPLDLRLSAKVALENFDKFDNANTSPPTPKDGVTSSFDYWHHAIGSAPIEASPAGAALVAEYLRQGFDKVDQGDGLLSRPELREVADSMSAPSELSGAAKAGVRLMDLFDTAAGGGWTAGEPPDGKIGMSDLEAVIEKGKQAL